MSEIRVLCVVVCRWLIRRSLQNCSGTCLRVKPPKGRVCQWIFIRCVGASLFINKPKVTPHLSRVAIYGGGSICGMSIIRYFPTLFERFVCLSVCRSVRLSKPQGPKNGKMKQKRRLQVGIGRARKRGQGSGRAGLSDSLTTSIRITIASHENHHEEPSKFDCKRKSAS